MLPNSSAAFFVGSEVVSMIRNSGAVAQAVLVILLGFSLFSWSIIFAKWLFFRKARAQTARFLKVFRRAPKLADLAAVADQFRPSPLVEVFDAGYQELRRQLAPGNPGEGNPKSGQGANVVALQRALQMAASEQMSEMESLVNWLATTGAVTPFIGLFGTVWGIMDAFHGLGTAGGASLRAVAPGISEALITTAAGLFAAVPAVIAYNVFLHAVREFGARMDNFGLELLNVAERHYT